MQKIKYIVIFILTLALIFVYIQLDDYNKISNSLLQHNSSSSEKINNLQEKISNLENENEELKNSIFIFKEKIFLLEEELELSKCKNKDTNTTITLDNNISNDINNTTDTQIFETEEKSIFDRILNR